MNRLEAERHFAQRMKDGYPPGTRILLLQMGDDPHPIEAGTRGTVVAVDDSDVVFALNETSRNAISDAVLEAYEQRLHMEEDESQDIDEPEEAVPVFEQRM